MPSRACIVVVLCVPRTPPLTLAVLLSALMAAVLGVAALLTVVWSLPTVVTTAGLNVGLHPLLGTPGSPTPYLTAGPSLARCR